MSTLAQQRDKRNYALHLLYTRQEFDECLKQIEKILGETDGLCEYAIYIKALIMRHRGKIQDSLQLFQQATAINPHNVANLKQVGRSLYLLGKHKAAVDVYEEAAKFGAPDWEIMHNKGLCYMYLKQYDKAIESFRVAIDIQPHDSTFLQLGKVYSMMDDYGQAINVYMEALEHSPENPEILTTLGLLFLRTNDNNRAFEYLSTSLTHDPRNPRTILAAGSIIQDHSDMDVALVKYRVAAVQTPNSPQLWNNIGMCFFGKQRYIAAIACLKKALYLGPFEWIISYNLGLVHLHTGQYASAFHYFSASVNLKPDFAHSYMYLAVTLARLDDVDNACAAYEKAIQMAGLPGEPVFHLNYAILLYSQKQYDTAKLHLHQFRALFSDMDEEARRADPEVAEQAGLLGQLLGM
ncbi:BBS4 protein [Gonium pectorale]|uniref:BBS4 protein n=1 Tax=Gonium pectorale TaxID=33097 RepID=A0A150GU21_GONPE|nr:BBS4 protein [Gonium pectorale]|eukprot:KXZ53232.1 BBS4 protein [Gonium pectorale]